MARKLKISICSADRPLQYQGKKDGSLAVAYMKKYWENQLMQAVNDCSDIVLLPEACDRFMPMDEDFKKEYDEVRLCEMPLFFRKFAKEHQLGILYSSKTKSNNSTFIFDKKGNETGRYDKVFPMIDEMNQGIKPGKGAKIYEVDRIKKAGFAICFDLNFEEIKEEYRKLKPEVIFFSSMFHGGFLQTIWAYHTRCFFVSSILGKESRIIAPNGRVLASTSNYNNHCSGIVNLDAALIHLDENSMKFQAIKHKYKDQIIIDDTGYLGSVMIYNELHDCTIDDIINEFKLERLDDYYNRSRNKREEFLY